MAVQYLLLLTGFVVLIISSYYLVEYAIKLSNALGVSTFVIAVTVIALGTSIPELVVNIIAANNEAPDLGVGNILGSNIANIAFVLGATALLSPVPMDKKLLRFEIPFMIGSVVALLLLSYDNVISRLDGVILLILCLIFNGGIIYLGKKNQQAATNTNTPEKEKVSIFPALALTLVAIVFLILGAELIVNASVTIARHFKLSELFIGITIIAVGTSLPELAASISAVIKKEDAISVGNIVGSNVLNILLILGITAIIFPIKIQSKVLTVDIPSVLLFSLVLSGAVILRKSLGRGFGFLLISGYFSYIFLSYTQG